MTGPCRALTSLVILAALGLAAAQGPPARPPLPRIAVSADKAGFVEVGTGRPFTPWGANYDHDRRGRLIEDYWHDEWPTVVADFEEMKALRFNVVRVHLQLGRFLTDPTHSNPDNVAKLEDLIALAERLGLYLDITGLGCYHKADVPAWFDALSEADRWAAQATFWRLVATACGNSPAVFCYDLMNEPIAPGGDKVETEWLGGELGGKFFVQRIALEPRGRTNKEIAKAWIETLTAAIRPVDSSTLITVGVIPWAQVFPGAKPIFHDPDVGRTLDLVSIHLYPRTGKLDADLAATKAYDVGKPLVIEEIFPLSATPEEALTFLEKARPPVDGVISFYWGKTIDEADRSVVAETLAADWLARFRDGSPVPAASALASPAGEGPLP